MVMRKIEDSLFFLTYQMTQVNELCEKLLLGNFSLARNYFDVLKSHASGHLRTAQQNLQDTSGISLGKSCDGKRVCITLVCSHTVQNERDIAATRSHTVNSPILTGLLAL